MSRPVLKTPSSTPELSGDAAQVVAVLAWAQSAGLSVQSVAVGACRVELHRAIAPEPRQRPERDRRLNVYEQALDGAEQLAKAIADSGIPINELQPAVGR